MDMPPRLLLAAQRLRNVCLECRDALDLIPRWDLPGTVIYVDPPYIGDDRKHPRHGYTFDATPELWPSLVNALSEIRHAAVLLSGYPNEEVSRLGWRSVEIGGVLRGVPANGVMTTAPETLWLSPAVSDCTPSLFEVVSA